MPGESFLENQRLLLMPNYALSDVTPSDVAALLSPFLEADTDRVWFPPHIDIDKVYIWIANLETEMVRFVRDCNTARKSPPSPAQFMHITEFSDIFGLDLELFLETIDLPSVSEIYLYGSYELWLGLFTSTIDAGHPYLGYYHLFKLAVSHFNKLGPRYYDLHSSLLSGRVVRRHGDDEGEKFDLFQTNCVDEGMPYGIIGQLEFS